MNQKITHLLILLIVCYFSFFIHNQVIYADIMESRNLVTAREIVTEGNWLVPTMNGVLRLEKPPLPTWVAACLEICSPDNHLPIWPLLNFCLEPVRNETEFGRLGGLAKALGSVSWRSSTGDSAHALAKALPRACSGRLSRRAPYSNELERTMETVKKTQARHSQDL